MISDPCDHNTRKIVNIQMCPWRRLIFFVVHRNPINNESLNPDEVRSHLLHMHAQIVCQMEA